MAKKTLILVFFLLSFVGGYFVSSFFTNAGPTSYDAGYDEGISRALKAYDAGVANGKIEGFQEGVEYIMKRHSQA